MSGSVRLERDGAIAWIVVDHLVRRNAISRHMWEALPPIVREIDADEDLRVAVIRGAGEEAFIAGADISEFDANRVGPGAAEYDRMTDEAFTALATMQKPLIAMIHGFCIGGGCGIALSADLRYAADDARFAIPPARLGLGYSTRNVKALVDVVGQAAAREVLFTARRYDAVRARTMGLVHDVLPKAELEGFVRKMAASVADNAPLTVRAAKVNLDQMRLPAAERDREAMQSAIVACFDSEDYQEGIRAFLEKRRPVFRGK